MCVCARYQTFSWYNICADFFSLLRGRNREIVKVRTSHGRGRQESRTPKLGRDSRFSVDLFYRVLLCLLSFFSAGRVTVLCTGTTLWSAAVTEMLRRRWTEEFWRENTMMKIVILLRRIILAGVFFFFFGLLFLLMTWMNEFNSFYLFLFCGLCTLFNIFICFFLCSAINL